MGRLLSLGIIGGGINSAVGRAHLSALRVDGLWHLKTGFFSRNAFVNSESAIAWGVETSHPDLDAFIQAESGELDAVLVLTPTPNHFEAIQKLLIAGFNVISEKALCSTSDEAGTLIDLAIRHQRKLFVTFNYTGFPMVREIRSRINSGKYGKIHSINIEMPQESFILRDLSGGEMLVQDWRQKDGSIPTVSLDLGVHVLNLASFLLSSELESVSALQSHSGNVSDVIDKVFAIGNYSRGINCTLMYGKVFPGFKNGLKFRIFGDLGGCEWLQIHPDSFFEYDNHGGKQVIDQGSLSLLEANSPRYARFKAGHPTGFIEAFSNLYLDIHSVLSNSQAIEGSSIQDFVFPGEKALIGLRELEVLHRSAESKVWMNISGVS